MRSITSIEICVQQCSAKCCKGQGYLKLLPGELDRLVHLAHDGLQVIEHQGSPVIVFMMNGGRCPFLGYDNLCRIYDERPQGCRGFPFRPTEWCMAKWEEE